MAKVDRNGTKLIQDEAEIAEYLKGFFTDCPETAPTFYQATRYLARFGVRAARSRIVRVLASLPSPFQDYCVEEAKAYLIQSRSQQNRHTAKRRAAKEQVRGKRDSALPSSRPAHGLLASHYLERGCEDLLSAMRASGVQHLSLDATSGEIELIRAETYHL